LGLRLSLDIVAKGNDRIRVRFPVEMSMALIDESWETKILSPFRLMSDIEEPSGSLKVSRYSGRGECAALNRKISREEVATKAMCPELATTRLRNCESNLFPNLPPEMIRSDSKS
jgi:hypothetical protein